MSKYGKVELGAPDISTDVAALKDLYEKGEIEKTEYHKRLDALQREKLMYIAKSNGGYTPSKKAIKQYNQLMESLSEAKKKHEIWKQQQTREEFLTELSKQQEEAKAAQAAQEETKS
jgi:DNA-binding transcriptional regulator GbsR (MarR family)